MSRPWSHLVLGATAALAIAGCGLTGAVQEASTAGFDRSEGFRLECEGVPRRECAEVARTIAYGYESGNWTIRTDSIELRADGVYRYCWVRVIPAMALVWDKDYRGCTRGDSRSAAP